MKSVLAPDTLEFTHHLTWAGLLPWCRSDMYVKVGILRFMPIPTCSFVVAASTPVSIPHWPPEEYIHATSRPFSRRTYIGTPSTLRSLAISYSPLAACCRSFPASLSMFTVTALGMLAPPKEMEPSAATLPSAGAFGLAWHSFGCVQVTNGTGASLSQVPLFALPALLLVMVNWPKSIRWSGPAECGAVFGTKTAEMLEPVPSSMETLPRSCEA
mmetsp:Transcript_65128/g.179960  ORF Transcript_65128/g.179960 Transcript_65128/m.179960 type:complete len:214 (+) Transcript_65128:168-809(+)